MSQSKQRLACGSLSLFHSLTTYKEATQTYWPLAIFVSLIPHLINSRDRSYDSLLAGRKRGVFLNVTKYHALRPGLT